MNNTPRPPARSKDDLLALALDTVVVAALAIGGHLAHHKAFALGAVAMTALPFWTGALMAHVFFKPLAIYPRGLKAAAAVWLTAWAVGLGGRLLLGQTNALPFVLVAGATLALGAFGWRAAYLTISRGRRRSRPSAGESPDLDEKSSSSPGE